MRYKLPESLGGGEYETVDATGAIASCQAFIVDGHTVLVHRALLTEVRPPLPEEPAVGAVVLDRYGQAWQNTGGWSCTTSTDDEPWSELHTRYGPLTRLVSDPFAEPVELPWRLDGGDNDNDRPWGLGVESTRTDLVLVLASIAGRGTGVRVDSGNARAMARALMTAADAAEKEQP